MVIRNLQLENFLSFKKLNLDFNGVKSIQGLNLDDESQEANGTGKSAIQAGLEFVLFGSISRGVLSKDIVFWGEKDGYASLEIYCGNRASTLLIERTFGRKSTLSITENSQHLDFSTVNDGNVQILKWIGISKSDLKNYYIINKDSYDSFYTSSNTKKLDMIARFTNLSIIDGSDEVINKEVDTINAEITDKEKSIAEINGKIDSYLEFIENEQHKDFDSEYKKALHNIDSKIELYKHKIASEKLSLDANINLDKITKEIDVNLVTIEKYESEIDKLKDVINKSNINVEDVSKLIETENSVLNDFKQLKGAVEVSISDLKEKLSKAKIILSGEIVCPKCNNHFLLDGDIDEVKKEVSKFTLDIDSKTESLSDVEKEVLSSKDEISTMKTLLDGLRVGIDEINNTISETQNKIFSLKSENRNKLDEIDAYNSKQVRCKRNIEECEESIDSLIESKSNLKIGVVNDVLIKEYKDKIDECNNDISELEKSILETKEFLLTIMNWKFNFKQFRSELSSEVLSVLSSRSNKILDSMGSDLRVEWQGFKVKSDGSLSDKITPKVVRNGEYHSYGSYSGGERARLEFANILASQYLINSTNEYGGLDFLFVDEITEGLDSLGLDSLIKSFSEMGLNAYIISHVMNNVSNNNVITVAKENGESKIK